MKKIIAALTAGLCCVTVFAAGHTAPPAAKPVPAAQANEVVKADAKADANLAKSVAKADQSVEKAKTKAAKKKDKAAAKAERKKAMARAKAENADVRNSPKM